jgi:hypothetical protein
VRPTSLIVRVLALGATALAIPEAIAEDSESFIKDEGGCATWNPNPQPNESVRWSGQCKDGLMDGPGTLEWFGDGQLAGMTHTTMLQGRASGFTREQLLKRGIVDQVTEAVFENGLPQGYGEWRGVEEGSRYVGEFRDGQPDGVGALFRKGGGWVLAMFRKGLAEGFVTEMGRGGGMTFGILANEKLSGPGTMILTDGTRIDTRFVDDESKPGTACRQTARNGKFHMGTMTAGKDGSMGLCEPSAGVDLEAFMAAAASSINSAATAYGYESKVDAADPYAYIDQITRLQADKLRKLQAEALPAEEGHLNPLPDGCLVAETSKRDQSTTVTFKNLCNEVVNVNICMRIGGRNETGRQSQQVAKDSSVQFEYYLPADARYDYNYRYCRPDRTTVLDNCPVPCL